MSEPTIEEAARRMAGSRPLPLGAWREVMATGALAADRRPGADPDASAAALVRRWHQRLAVAVDEPIERGGPGAERLPQLLTAWLDLARKTAPVRGYVRQVAGPRTAAVQDRHEQLLVDLLAEDLALLGAPAPRRSALDLVRELHLVAEEEDGAGRVLPARRAALLTLAGVPERRRSGSGCPLRLLASRLHLAPAG